MKRIVISLGLILCLTVQILPNSNALTKSEQVLKGFQSYISISKLAFNDATQKYNNAIQKNNSDTAAINAIQAASVQVAKSTFEKEILAAKNLYEPQINNATQAIKDAQAKLLTVTQVKVLKQGSDRNKWGYLNCSATRPDCIYVDKGPLFQIGEVTTLKTFAGNPMEFDYLRDIQMMIDDGLIELLNAVEYQKAVNIIRTESEKKKALSAQWPSADTAAAKKQSSAVEEARKIASGPWVALMQNYELIEQNYESDKLVFDKQIIAGNTAIRAAKRASKNPSVFDKAFVTAYKFEYNVKGLDDIANLPFSSMNTLRSVLSQYAIIELADKAIGVNAAYSYSAAEKINKSVGNAFISDEEFQARAKLVSVQYKKLTKISLKF